MKQFLYLLTVFSLITSCIANKTKERTMNFEIDPSLIHYSTDNAPGFVRQVQMDSILKNISENDNFLFIDLYPVIDTLPIADTDPFILAERLEEMGFVLRNWERGNWENGPRFYDFEYEKDDLQCHIYKYFMYNEPDKDDRYNLLVYEQIECKRKTND